MMTCWMRASRDCAFRRTTERWTSSRFCGDWSYTRRPQTAINRREVMLRGGERARGLQLDLKTIEALAPDQASLGAAAKLTKRSNWPRLEAHEQLPLIWGECQ